jgi:hypothetical protein
VSDPLSAEDKSAAFGVAMPCANAISSDELPGKLPGYGEEESVVGYYQKISVVEFNFITTFKIQL